MFKQTEKMDGKNSARDNNLLIDFSSPRPKYKQTKLHVQSPRIDKIIDLSVTIQSNSDVNTNQISPFKDPFEEVFANAYLNNKIEEDSTKTEDEKQSTTPDNVKPESSKHDPNVSAKEEDIVPIEITQTNVENKEVIPSDIKTCVKNIEESKNTLQNSDENVDNSFRSEERENCTKQEIVQEIKVPTIINVKKSNEVTEEIIETEIVPTSVGTEGDTTFTNMNTNNITQTKITSKSVVVTDGEDSQSCISVDFSTDEGLKATIAKRVNRCIQKVLNNSLKQKNKNEDIGMKKTLNKRSLSFVSQTSKVVKCNRLNKSCEQFNLEKEELVNPESSGESHDISLLSSGSDEESKMEDSVFLPTEKDLVFKEANKLARTFSKIAESFCNMSESDSDDDLLTCQPRWTYAESSEDEEEKLRKDPALNIRVSLTNSVTKTNTRPDSDALSAFKSRLRLNSSQSSPEETDVKKNLPVPIPIKMPAIPTSILPSVPVPKVKLEEKSIKVEKTNKESKRVPMKATMPVQCMTKDSILDEGKTKNPPSPPVKRKNSESLLKTPTKDGNQSEIRPVASSTPNKSVIIGSPNLMSTSAIIPPNKRHSLGTANEHKIRTPEAETRQRSNSASGIPTPRQDIQKKAHKASQLKFPAKPKSASSLHRIISNNSSQMSSPHEKKAGKVMKTSFNPRALNEVKLQRKSPISNRVKGITSAITGLVAGKSKKRIAVGDKENRVPY
ncbi:uncharacterized protein LOC124360546 [Homalodisca vitripennis]|uniref:uncharacterized protein LOC124360546 n=2 Tax=Homalodisca vitripennis TaxID=197043 RepID=UPI001EEB6AB5|nr:uncharacterized protein LOC124360546 [Homalodisca vitripennis]XP_046670214.1 uncharacterized protein LOC124360546 [Homalodisca vitripennis]